MKVVIDRDNCGNCQLCADACPEVFEIQQGEIEILCNDVPPAFETDCLFARESCPGQAIEIRNTARVFRDGQG